MKTLFAMAAFVVALSMGQTMAFAIEEPKFQVTRQLQEGVDVREYAAYLVAEVVVPGPASDAGGQGFGILAGYIFGKNKGERKIDMTAPVLQTTAGQKLEMTAPVSQSATDGGYLVQFVMPNDSTLDTLPEPNDNRVHLRTVSGARYAVIRYSGFWSDSNYRDHLETLRKSLETAGLETTGEPIYARYDPPWTPWFMRRNEIWLKLV